MLEAAGVEWWAEPGERPFLHPGRAASIVAAQDERNQEVASEAFLARGDLLLRLNRVVEARADLADAATRMTDPVRKKSLEAFLAS